ncbi:glycoside hydrolase family 43 protein [Viridothelium virens]|uniref:Glycoside hydrolase family 43 protein n=1 Tax=Viridothelium virens TaxID=1048519 RepID=A0A6A6HAM8_VIRVR|nr:glycoside hydrolase family 43 protein [Viridothelium virens]
MYKSPATLTFLLSSLFTLGTPSPVDTAANVHQKRAEYVRGISSLEVKRSENGPVITQNFPDPSIIKVGSTWWAFATESAGTGINIPMASSTDFKTWIVTSQDALPNTPPWVNMTAQALWAPDANQLDDGTFVLYFSAAVNNNSAHHCVGAATSKNVNGPYVPQSDPLFCPIQQGGAIDPAGFKDWQVKGNWTAVNGNWNSKRAAKYSNNNNNSWTNASWSQGGMGGQRYITYKVDGNSLGNGDLAGYGNCGNTVSPIVPTPIVLQAVAADGVTIQGSAVTILNNNGLSDNGVVEAPSLVKSAGGEYVLFFSNGCYDTANYTVNYATASSVSGPYTRNGPLFQTGTDGLYAPGGADVLWDAQHMVFHADYPDHNATNRPMYTAIINIQGNTVTA